MDQNVSVRVLKFQENFNLSLKKNLSRELSFGNRDNHIFQSESKLSIAWIYYTTDPLERKLFLGRVGSIYEARLDFDAIL